jgi:hypothetical protein
VKITVQRDDFFKGSPENPWPEVFGEFSGQIRAHLGATTHDLLLPSFSTTGGVERAAAEVVLLDAMQSYFSYEFKTLCGIPHIALEGTPDDWAQLADRTRGLAQFGLGWWTDALAPVLDQFTAASQGRADVRFWQSIYKLDRESGGPFASGWITTLFPYLKDGQSGLATCRNPWLQERTNTAKGSRPQFNDGPTTEAFPSGMARAPFVWDYLGKRFAMEFLGGFVGVAQEADTLRLRPEIGWAVREQFAA